MKSLWKPSYLLAAMIAVLWLEAAPMHPELPTTEKVISVGSSQIIGCRNVTRVVVGDPYIADVVALSSNEILLNGKAPGSTVLYVWDACGRKTYKVTVKPQELDLSGLCSVITCEVADPRVCVRTIGTTIILEGKVSSQADSTRAEAIAKAVVERATARNTLEADKLTATTTDSKTAAEAAASPQRGIEAIRVVNLLRIERDISEVTARTIETAEAVRQTLNNPSLTVRALPDDLVAVEGKVGTEGELAKIADLLKGWITESKGPAAPGGEQTVTVMNHVQIDTSVARQILVRCQIVDIERTAMEELGADWGKVVFKKSDVPGQDVVATVEDQPWLIGQDQFGPFNLFTGGGPILRFDPIGARVKALENKNRARVLSEPNLLVLDGKEGNILVGGEIPIPIVQSAQTGTVATVTIEYKQFGAQLRVQPTITTDDNIQLRIAPELSSLDYANAVVMSGFLIPALRVRKAETVVNLRSGASIIIGGLIQNEMSKAIKQIPLLGDIPVIGEIFKMKTFKNGETELCIIITPEIIKPNTGFLIKPSACPAR